MPNPYCRLRPPDLEAIFEDKLNDRSVLLLLEEALIPRVRSRPAKRLLAKVRQRLHELSNPEDQHTVPDTLPTPAPPQNETAPQPEEVPASIMVPPDIAVPPILNSQQPYPPLTDDPEQILAAWTSFEVLSPATYRRPNDLTAGKQSVANLGDGELPWERGESSLPKKRLYYQIVLGSIDVEKAVNHLLSQYADVRPEGIGAKGKAPLAVVITDRHGRLVAHPEQDSVEVSSFPWGVMKACGGDLSEMGEWTSAGERLVNGLQREIVEPPRDENDTEARPLTRDGLHRAYAWLVEELRLPTDWIDAPHFAIRSYMYYMSNDPPEPIIVNSFFLPDLLAARRNVIAGSVSANIMRMLNKPPPSAERKDLLRDNGSMEEAVAPGRMPLARWPGPGRHPLVLLQQAAVNLAFQETRDGGIVGVNGPPGTGKTTLLRDIVAGIVAERAVKMAEYEDPADAFSYSGQQFNNQQATVKLYKLSADVRGFEILVASSNNRAVENVSAELPGAHAVSSDAAELQYFKTISDAIHGRETWGLIAAVLGNSSNRYKFSQEFWRNEDCGLNTYLRWIEGARPTIDFTDPDTGRTAAREPIVVTNENPPQDGAAALRQWQTARSEFNAALKNSQDTLDRLESLRQDIQSLQSLAAAESEAASGVQYAVHAMHQAEEEVEQIEREQESAGNTVGTWVARLAALDVDRPGFWARLFQTHRATIWNVERANVCAELANAEATQAYLDRRAKAASEKRSQCQTRIRESDKQHNSASVSLADCRARISAARQVVDSRFIDNQFFRLPRDAQQLTSPWLSSETQRIRDNVFIATMKLHKAFVDAAATPIRHNLSALMKLFYKRSLGSEPRDALRPDLWATLFLVVPVVSSTFASVSRMLGRLPKESLGWLLVDEAGQALPQAAVGALSLTRKAVVVGDPIQVPPVVTLPAQLVEAISRRCGVNPEQFAAPESSVQTMADRVSRYASEFATTDGSRSVGIPLLVHRRCADPMFAISNSVAYAGLMVPATPPRTSIIRETMGPSQWINVAGSGTDKWSAAEGEEVVRIMRELRANELSSDMYIVTPFRQVAKSLRDTIVASNILDGWVDGDAGDWTKERVGTVHTVQGREAELVIFVLGAPEQSQSGARNWAGWPPNIVNVAVTRAKEVLYVVGNRELWKNAGCFSDVDRWL